MCYYLCFEDCAGLVGCHHVCPEQTRWSKLGNTALQEVAIELSSQSSSMHEAHSQVNFAANMRVKQLTESNDDHEDSSAIIYKSVDLSARAIDEP